MKKAVHSPAMILNILGLRMAGQMSLRKTKPLEDRDKHILALCNMHLSKHMQMQLDNTLPNNSRSHCSVRGPFLLHRCLQTAVNVPQGAKIGMIRALGQSLAYKQCITACRGERRLLLCVS